MLLLDGINTKPDSKLLPLPIDGTKWNGTEWVYPPTVQLQDMYMTNRY